MNLTTVHHGLGSRDVIVSAVGPASDFHDIAWQCLIIHDTVDVVSIALPPGAWTVTVTNGERIYTTPVTVPVEEDDTPDGWDPLA